MHVRGVHHRHYAGERLLDLRCIASDQHYGARVLRHRRAQLAEVRALAVAAGDQYHRRIHAAQGRHRGAHVGALGIVDPAHTVSLRDQLGAVVQSEKPGDGALHGIERYMHDFGQRHGGKHVQEVVPAGNQHSGCRQKLARASRQPGLAAVRHQAVVDVARRRVRAEMHTAAPRQSHCHHGRVIGIQHHDTVTAIDTRLGGCVVIKARVAIHVVGRDIENGRGTRIQARSRLKLVTRQFQHIHLGLRHAQQIERRHTDVAANGGIETRFPTHLANQARDRTFSVRAGDGHDRRLRHAREQLDVAHHLDATLDGFGDRRFLERDAGTHHQQTGNMEQRRLEATGDHTYIRQLGMQCAEPGRLSAAVDNRNDITVAREITRTGQAAQSQAHHQRAFVVCLLCHCHRRHVFALASLSLIPSPSPRGKG